MAATYGQPPAPPTLAAQLGICAAGEMLGMAVSVGSVLIARSALPQQTQALERFLGKLLSQGGSPAQAEHIGRLAADFTLMNLGGAANLATQLTLKRANTPPEQRVALGMDTARVLAGRLAGTAGAAAAVILAEHHARGLTSRAESAVAGLLPFRDAIHLPGGTERLSSLLVLNLTQSLGALLPNAGAQLLFDRLTCRTAQPELRQ